MRDSFRNIFLKHYFTKLRLKSTNFNRFNSMTCALLFEELPIKVPHGPERSSLLVQLEVPDDVTPSMFKQDTYITNQLIYLQLGGKMKQMTGKVGESLVEAAKEEHAAMIIVGTRGMGKVRRTFLGSVSDYCVHHSHVPVLVCRHKDITPHHH